MDLNLFVEQVLNGCQFGVMLFMISAGLTLVFGIMNLINLAHGSLYMVGAYVAASVLASTGNFALAMLVAVPVAASWACCRAAGAAVVLPAHAPGPDPRDLRPHHGDQRSGAHHLGTDTAAMPLPEFLAGSVRLLPGLHYPIYPARGAGRRSARRCLLYVLVVHTRGGMWVRAGASDRAMASALGIDVVAVFSVVFMAGAALAGLAGVMAGPIFAVQVGMGETILILALVVIVVGGVGSIRGAFVAALSSDSGTPSVGCCSIPRSARW